MIFIDKATAFFPWVNHFRRKRDNLSVDVSGLLILINKGKT